MAKAVTGDGLRANTGLMAKAVTDRPKNAMAKAVAGNLASTARGLGPMAEAVTGRPEKNTMAKAVAGNLATTAGGSCHTEKAVAEGGSYQLPEQWPHDRR